MGAASRVWDEAKHPRGPGGKFAGKGSGAAKKTERAASHAAHSVDWVQPHSGRVGWAQPTRMAGGKAPSVNPRTAPHAPTPKGGVAWVQPNVDWVQPGGHKAPSVNPHGRTAPHAPTPKAGVAWAQPNADWVQPNSPTKTAAKAPRKRAKAPKAPAGGVAWRQPGVDWAQPTRRSASSMMR